jgi:hypothetical protein
MMRRVLWGATAVVAATMLAAGPAHAAFEVTAFSLTPSTVKAGANADVTIVAGFTPYPSALSPVPEQPRRVVFHLPPGLSGDPFATPKCTEAQYQAAACPANTQVGEVAVQARTAAALPANASGGVFNLVPKGAEPARLGAVVQPDIGGSPLLVPTVILVRAADGGLDSVIPELPRKAMGLDIYTERMTFTLFGKPPGAKGAFMRNPTSCGPATSTIAATPYTEGAKPVTRSSRFTPTDCGALPFAPRIEASIGANGKTGKTSRPPIRTVVRQGEGEANQKAVSVTLPPVAAPNFARLGVTCQPELALTRGCPDTTRVGTVEAVTPLLAKPLGGSVFLTANPVAGGLPKLTIQLDDPIPLRLDGTPELTPQGIRTTFTGLPDAPLTRFQLDLDGLFQLGADLCTTAPPTVAAAFTGQSGATASDTQAMRVLGCTPPPTVKARISRLRSGKPRMKVRVAAAAGAPALTRVDVSLPPALKVKRKRRVATSAGTAKLTRGGDLRITLPRGTRAVKAKLRKGSLKAGRKLRRARKPRRQEVLVLVRDADGLRPPVALKVKPRRGA